MLIIAGFKGAGKTTFGKALAEHMRCPFFDTDHLLIEKYQKPIRDVFLDLGEESFRREEKRILESLKPSFAVLSLGGGALHEATKETILSLGKIVYLKLPDKEAIKRMLSHPLPSFIDQNRSYLHAVDIFKKRSLLFETLATWEISVG